MGSIVNLETMLIGVCLSQNEKLLNASKVKVFKELHVPGYMNEKPGPRKAPAKALRRMLNIE